MVPFILLSRTGFTTDLVNMCTSLCTRGMNFYNIETFILERRLDAHARQQDMLTSMFGECGHGHDFQTSHFSNSPSNDIISKLVLAKFLMDENLYLKEMISIPPGEAISFDHTFKVAANIGFLRDDGIWVAQYDSLFIVLNSEGKVITWQFTKGTAFSQIEMVLTDLKARSSSINIVYIDDCCKLRSKVQSLLGSHVLVKLDLFHAVKRITSTLCKKHSLIHQCMEDLQLVFRKDGDSGKRRMEPTPDPSIIKRKLDLFIDKWKDVTDGSGRKVFTPETLEARRKLQHHISAGCLSNIAPGGGTNRNERLHHHINSLFTRCKMGILLAYSLLTIILYAYNSSNKTHSRIITRPINASSLRDTAPIDIKPIGIIPKVREQQGVDHWEIDVAESTMDMEVVVPTFVQSLNKYKIMKFLRTMGLARLQKCTFDFIEFRPYTASNSSRICEDNLREMLYNYGLRIQPAVPDGNCFFASIALNILSDSQVWNHCLRLAGVTSHQISVDDLSLKLRQSFVNELLGERQSQYEAFVAHANLEYEVEANRFRENKFFDSELGNTMPLALATALQFPIIIFPNQTDLPIMYVTPEIVTTEATAFVVYTSAGPGHYDAALPCHKFASQKISSPNKCSCGINKTTAGRQTCIPSAIYATRCICFKMSQPCTSICRCVNCHNPSGARPTPTKESTRKRRKHSFQVVDVPTSKRFALERSELLSEAIWSDFESIVLHEICSKLEDNNEILKLYNDIVDYSKTTYCLYPLPQDVVFRSKSAAQISCKRITFSD